MMNSYETVLPEPQPSRVLTIIKIMLACGILFFLFLQIQQKIPYLKLLYDNLKVLYDYLKEYKKQVPLETKKESPEIIIKSSETQIEPPKPNVGKMFCYAGEWNGVRSCIDVNSLDECYSGEMYSSKSKCKTN